mgnify:CR=1 FL=1|tara:strand:+ start:768 stop:1148 length:381 start_codon:yes stop_codon:yes gene_type:complete
MNPEPEPVPDDIIQQDILLDDIKEFRKIISGLLYKISNNSDTNDECKTILEHFENMKVIEPFNYEYAYIGYDNVLRDYHKHKKYIDEIMNRLKNANDTVCDDIHNECYECDLYQYYYLGNDIYNED